MSDKLIHKINPKISVIIPIYNAEKTLEETVHSVMNQTYRNLEILLLNDGSTDLSGVICKKLENEDSRIKYFYHTNMGQSAERNFGIENSKGDYITFVDHDDLLDKNYYQKCIDIINLKNYSLVQVGVKTINTIKNETKLRNLNIPSGEYKLIDLINKPKNNHTVWNKLFNRTLFEDDKLRFPTIKDNYKSAILNKNIIFNEDIIFSYKLFTKDIDCYFINEYLYTHIFHENNLGKLQTKNKRSKLLAEINNYQILSFELIKFFRKEPNFDKVHMIIDKRKNKAVEEYKLYKEKKL